MRGMENRITLIAWLVFLLAGAGPALGASDARPATRPVAPKGPAAVLVLHDQINEASRKALVRDFEKAKAAGAKTVILDIKTNGGLVSEALEISHFLKGNRDVYTIAFVNNRALSAGAMISVACNEIVMAPVSTLGDCAPIAIAPDGQLVSMGKHEREKSESVIRNDFAESARMNGHDETLVLSMVTMERSVHWIEKNDAPTVRRFVDFQTFHTLTKDGGGWRAVKVDGVPNPIDEATQLLTLSADVAGKIGLSGGTYANVDAIAKDRGLTITRTYTPSFLGSALEVLGHPYARGVMIVLFLTFLYVALHVPGHGLAELVCVVTLALAVGVPVMTGHAAWWEVLLIIAGIILLAIEIFILPGFGVAGVSGLLLILAGFVLTFVAPEPGRGGFSMPTLPATWAALQTGLTVMLVGLLSSFAAAAVLRRFLPSLPMFNRLILSTRVGHSETAMAGSLTNIDPTENQPRIGARGVALTDLRPGGTAKFEDMAGVVHTVSVVSDSGYVKAQTPLVVREIEGIRILVRPVKPEDVA